MKLVDARAVRDVLVDNIDEHVSQFILFNLQNPSVFTTHGTLLSHPPSVLKRDLIKFAPFAGTVWRNHNAQIATTGTTSIESGGMREMRTLGLRLDSDSKALVELTVEMEGWVAVVRSVVGKLLVAARLESSKFEDVAALLDSDVDGDLKGTESGDDESVQSGEDQSSDVADARSQDRSLVNGEEESEKEETGRRPSKMRILELKAEGMAEFLAGEYPAKLSYDFY
ncbi:uncharacterized protein KY384_002659 [Bacidia gigantensis]|uniref:uncharacterized protein n=1 Tax=Bacidia gigantensis TaxID=2732470 RepID=UPI001D039C53|nr:uncharacterized protein KY384_002659 [Bacidia gigantensis]KAG8532781.1 hypothetical protein KY384_002659 [Bacidia gigantensis]